MQFLTQTKWPFWVILVLAVALFVLQNRNLLTDGQVKWLLGVLALSGTQAGVHTERPITKEHEPTVRITIPPKGEP